MTTACPDWADRLREGRSIIPPPIYANAAEEALAIFKSLKVVDLPGKPTFGECSEQWVFDFVAVIFGANDPETGKQLIREFYLLISKKNTKSTIAAGIMLTALILCWRDEEEHLILAPTKEVADNSYKPAAAMVRADDELSALFAVQDHLRTISHRESRSSLKVVAADSETVSGKKAGRVLVDEHWLFGKRANADGMFMEALGGQISRDEGFVIYLSTQSDDPPAGVFKTKLDYFRGVRDGTIDDPKSLGVLYEFPPDIIASGEYTKPENFRIVNPNLGKSVSQEWLVDQLAKIHGMQDGSLQKFLAKHLNVEIGLNLRSDRWPGADFWQQQGDTKVTLDYLIERADVITVGIDGGGLDDLLGLAVMGRDSETGNWLLWTHAWAHPIVLERRKSEASKFMEFERDGDLTFAKSLGDDVLAVADLVERLELTGKLDRIGVDAVGLGGIVDAIAEKGLDIPTRVIAVPQGYKLMGAIKTTERKLAGGQMLHGGQRLMNYCVSNAKIVAAGNAILITKQAAGTAKIDPLMATINASSLMALNPAPRAPQLLIW